MGALVATARGRGAAAKRCSWVEMLKLLLLTAATLALAQGSMVGGDVDAEEGVPPPWIRMVKKSSFTEDRDGDHGGEGGGLAPPWVRMVKKRQEGESQHGSPRMNNKLQLLERESIQEKLGERARRTEWSKEGGLGSYRPGLWRMAAIRSLKKRELGEGDKAWMLRMIQKNGN